MFSVSPFSLGCLRKHPSIASALSCCGFGERLLWRFCTLPAGVWGSSGVGFLALSCGAFLVACGLSLWSRSYPAGSARGNRLLKFIGQNRSLAEEVWTLDKTFGSKRADRKPMTMAFAPRMWKVICLQTKTFWEGVQESVMGGPWWCWRQQTTVFYCSACKVARMV